MKKLSFGFFVVTLCGCVAAEGRWAVLEDRKGRRLLRLKMILSDHK